MLALCTYTYQADAQCWHWAVNMGGSNLESPVSISVDPNGQSAITGEFQGTAIIGNDTLTAVYGRDVFTAIMDSNGMVLKGLAGFGDGAEDIGNGVASDSNGNIFITVNFTGTITFSDTPLESAGLGDIFIVKYDAAGSLLWARRAGGAGNIYAKDIAIDPAGNCYITGEFYDSASFGDHIVYSTIAQDVFAAKYDPDGNPLWAAGCGFLSGDWGNGIAVDSRGNVFVAGEFQSQFIFNDICYSSEGNLDGFLAKYDVSGTPKWAVTGGGSGNEFFNKVAVDAGGTSQWGIRAGSLGHDYANDVAVDGNGDVYITGTFNDTIVFDDISLVNPSWDLYLAKLDSSGMAVWAKQPEVNTALGSGKSVVACLNRPLITGDLVAGMAPPILVFDDDTLISNGSADAFVAKVGPPCDVATGLADHFNNPPSLAVYPNPFQDVLNIRLDDRVPGHLELKLYNLQGGLVWSERYYGGEYIRLGTDHLPSGI